jgi:hypothetical protein
MGHRAKPAAPSRLPLESSGKAKNAHRNPCGYNESFHNLFLKWFQLELERQLHRLINKDLDGRSSSDIADWWTLLNCFRRSFVAFVDRG